MTAAQLWRTISCRASGDNHDVWIDPLNPERILVANDQGANVSLNRGKTYEHITLPIAQMYHVYTDTKIPYNVFGNRQDGESYTGPATIWKAASLAGRSAPAIGRATAAAKAASAFPIRRTPTLFGPAATTAASIART